MFFFIFIVNLSILGVGFVIKKYNIGNIIIGFNSKKDDERIISKLVGENLILMGIMLLFGEGLVYIVRDKIDIMYYMYFILLTIGGFLLNIYGRWFKIRKEIKK